MTVTQYIGARYVPLFADPIEWSKDTAYEPLTIVIHEGNSYTSRQAVPKGIDIANDEFWALTSNYNAQVENYRKETAKAVEDASNALSLAQTNEQDIATLDSEMAGTADSGLKGLIEKNSSRISLIENNPNQMGIVPLNCVSAFYIATNRYNDNVTTNNVVNGQGLAIDDDGTYYVAVIENDNNGCIYSKTANASWAKHDDIAGIGHAGSNMWLNGALFVGGSGNEIFKLSSDLNSIAETYTISGINAAFLAYDSKQNKAYTSDSGVGLYELDTTSFQATSLAQWTGFNFRAYGTLQDFTAYNGLLYALYSDEGCIRIWDINSGEYIATWAIPTDNGVWHTGEEEGIDITSNGELVFNCVSFGKTSSFAYHRLYSLNVEKPFAFKNHVTSNEYQRTNLIYTQEATNADLLSGIVRYGTSSAQFLTVDEAIEAAALSSATKKITINGDHSSESIILTDSIVLGFASSNSKIGAITAICPTLTIWATGTIAPQTKVSYFIDARECSSLTVDSRVSADASVSGEPTAYIRFYGQLNKGHAQTSAIPVP